MNTLENADLFQIINFIVEYRNQLGVFGPSLVDKRLSDGATVLTRTVGRRILKGNLSSVNSIVQAVNFGTHRNSIGNEKRS
jgi:hypothetical protein